MHYYKRNIGDYAKKAGRLSMLEHGAYTLLIDACYDRERFPSEQEAIEWAWARSDAEVEAVRFVLSRFFVLIDGVYVQDRIKEEIDAYARNAETNARIAKEREEKRTKRARSVNGASPDEHEPPPNHKPLTTNQEPIITAPQSDAKKRGSRLPQDWFLPQQWGQWALDKFPHFTVEIVRDEALKFANHWHSATGKSASKLDWYATWQNWCMSDICQRAHPPPGASSETAYARQMRERVAEAAGSFAHIVAAKAPGQQSKPSPTPWDVAIENNRRTIATGVGGCDLLEAVDDLRS